MLVFIFCYYMRRSLQRCRTIWIMPREAKNPHFKNINKYIFVMVNFMCQPDWATGCPDIWLNIMSLRGFLQEINIWISSLSKADCPLQCGWASLFHIAGLNRTKDWERKNLLSLPVFEPRHWSSPDFRLRLRLEVMPSAVLGLQLTDLGPSNLA